MRIISAIHLSVLIFTANTSAETIFFVAKTGSDSNSCTQAQHQATPKLTVRAGAACLSTGDTLYIKTGIYSEQSNSINLPAGISWKTVTTVSNFDTDVVVFQNAGNPFRIFNSKAAYISFKGLVFDGIDDRWKDGITIGQGSHHLRFTNVDVKNFGANGIHTGEDAPGNEFINCKIHDGGTTDFDHAFYIEGSDNLIDQGQVYRWSGAAVHLYNRKRTVNRNVVRFLYAHNTSAGVSANIPLSDGGNFTNGFRSWGIVVYSGDDNRIYGNRIANLRGKDGFAILVAGGATDTKIYNNIFYNNGRGLSLARGTSGAIIKNNIIYGTTMNDALGTVFSNNLCDAPNIGCSLVGDPLFLDPKRGRFELQRGSPAIGAGTPNIAGGISVNKNGRPPDIGGL